MIQCNTFCLIYNIFGLFVYKMLYIFDNDLTSLVAQLAKSMQ